MSKQRKPLIAGNWKMYKTHFEAKKTAESLISRFFSIDTVEVMIAPSFVSLVEAGRTLQGSTIALGAQDMHWAPEGAFTGEVSGPMLAAAGCSYVIVGHSERRQYFSETDETVNKKIAAALKVPLIPIMCVGETKSEREAGQTLNVLDRQLNQGLKNIAPGGEGLVIAYEPVWAIGTGLTATSGQAQDVHAHIRAVLESLFGKDLAKRTRILYGGSVKPGNIRELMGMPDVDGALVGGASLDAESFAQIVENTV